MRQLLNAQEYWRVKGLRADVVILNEHPADYLDEMQELLTQLVQEPPWAGWLGKPGGMFLLRADGMPEPDRRLLSAVASVVLPGDLGDLVSQLERPAPWLYDEHDVPRVRRPARAGAARRRRCRSRRWSWRTASAASRRDGREYVVVLDGERETPLPWSNVLANPDVRHDREQLRLGVHLGGQQPREPADAVRQRSVDRSDRRGHLPARRGDRRGLGRHAGPLPRRADGGRWVDPPRAPA